MARETCMLCGEPLPPPKWWARITGTSPPSHDPDGPDGDACWAGLNKRIGIEDPGPKPTNFKHRLHF